LAEGHGIYSEAKPTPQNVAERTRLMNLSAFLSKIVIKHRFSREGRHRGDGYEHCKKVTSFQFCKLRLS